MRFKRRIKKLRRRSRDKGFEPDITTQWFRNKIAIQKKCAQTNQLFDFENSRGPRYPSVDRINNDLGYTKDNCQIVTMIYNRSKHAFPEEVFDMWIKKLIEKADR